jgi:hypothetical protein
MGCPSFFVLVAVMRAIAGPSESSQEAAEGERWHILPTIW